ncbi:hypothetical protein LTR95_017369 [Oleoguttula sp. CCFEE 5521]
MAHHQRTVSSNQLSTPHSVSLKVLRLSRPALATQTPLPQTSFGNGLDISPSASLAHPAANPDSSFPLAPLLTLPSAFGAAYVGETFACTLCANNELTSDSAKSVSGVRISCELRTPSAQSGLALELSDSDNEPSPNELQPGATLQRAVHHPLKEEGTHVLAITVNYTETTLDEQGGASGGRARTFRKLYQFIAQNLVAVRSKVTALPQRSKDSPRAWSLEAQLENVGEASVVIEKVWLREDEGLEGSGVGSEEGKGIVLKPMDVEQVMFVVRELEAGAEQGKRNLTQLNIEWRSAMGERGSLTTGWLSRKA